MFLNRSGYDTIERYLAIFPALGITGPRQSGKTTLLKEMLKEYQYVTFDDLKNIDYFEQDPEGFMAQYHDHVIFDEVQFVPDIFHYIKLAIDEDRQAMGKFVLTGSSQFAYLKKASESLAGRIGLMSLLPFDASEMPKALLSESIYQGGYPELVLRDYRESALWYSSYLETYLNKDVRALSQIGNMRSFRHFIQLLAAQVGQVLEYSQYAKNLGVSVPTIKRWISILEASYIIFVLPVYHKNFGKRLTKSPKVYFYDTGLVSYLVGIRSFEQYDQGPMAGALFENYIISDIHKKMLHRALDADCYFLRTQDKAEVDLVIEWRNRGLDDNLEFFEIKKSATFAPKMITTLKQYAEFGQGHLLYQGKTLTDRSGIKITNFRAYLDDSLG